MMLNVNLSDLIAFDEALAGQLASQPADFLPRVRWRRSRAAPRRTTARP